MLLILNDVAGSEILLILVFVLIFFGSKSIPGLARTLGRTIRQVKDASSDIQKEIRKSGMDMKKDLNLKGILEETAEDIKRPLEQHARDIDEAVKFQPHRRQSHMEQNIAPVEGGSEQDETKVKEVKPEGKNDEQKEQ